MVVCQGRLWTNARKTQHKTVLACREEGQGGLPGVRRLRLRYGWTDAEIDGRAGGAHACRHTNTHTRHTHTENHIEYTKMYLDFVSASSLFVPESVRSSTLYNVSLSRCIIVLHRNVKPHDCIVLYSTRQYHLHLRIISLRLMYHNGGRRGPPYCAILCARAYFAWSSAFSYAGSKAATIVAFAAACFAFASCSKACASVSPPNVLA